MKKWTLALFFVLCTALLSSVVAAEGGSCGTNMTWFLDDDGFLTISGSGTMTNYTSSTPAPWNKENVITVYLEDGITSIGNYAFYNCSNIISALRFALFFSLSEGAV